MATWARGTFVAPADAIEAPGRTSTTPTETVAVVGPGGASVALGLSLAARLIRRRRAGSGLVLVRGEPVGSGGTEGWRPAAPRARRRAIALAARGLDIAAVGRVVVVGLEGEPEQAAGLAASLKAEEHDIVVTVLCGPRESAFDAVLADQQRIVLSVPAQRPDVLVTLAVEQIALLAPRASVVVEVPGRASWRPLAGRAAADRLLAGVDVEPVLGP